MGEQKLENGEQYPHFQIFQQLNYNLQMCDCDLV